MIIKWKTLAQTGDQTKEWEITTLYWALEESWAQWIGTSQKQVFLLIWNLATQSSHSEMMKRPRQKAARGQVQEICFQPSVSEAEWEVDATKEKRENYLYNNFVSNWKIWIRRKESRDKNQGLWDHINYIPFMVFPIPLLWAKLCAQYSRGREQLTGHGFCLQVTCWGRGRTKETEHGTMFCPLCS